MKKMFSAAALALAFAVSVGAQATPPTQSAPGAEPQASKAHKSASSKSVTLTGCLRQGDTPDSFALDNARINPSESGSASGTSGTAAGSTTGSSASSGTGTSTGMSAGMSGEDMGAVKLVTTADISLKEHVGHQVQVTGMMSGASGKMKDKSSSASSDTTGPGSSASSSSATGTSGAEKGKEGAHTLRVRALRHVSETCSK